MKSRLFFILLPLLILLQDAAAQEADITGFWKGTVTTPELKLPYELILSMENGKLTGYSHTTFTVRGTEMVSVKKLNIRLKNDQYIIEDEEMLFSNITEEAPKKIKQTNKLSLETAGRQWRLYGTFEARAPRMLKPAEGTVDLEKQADLSEGRLLARLQQLKLADNLSFASNKPTPPVAATLDKKPALPPASETLPAPPMAAVVKNEPVELPTSNPVNQNNNVALKKDTAVTVQTAAVTAKELIVPPLEVRKVQTPGVLAKVDNIGLRRKFSNPVLINTTARIAKLEPTRLPPADASIAKAPAPTDVRVKASGTPAEPKPKPLIVKPAVIAAIPAVPKKALVNVAVGPTVDLGKRQIETIQQLFIESDSLQFTLYDNGEVDGDTVSVILNGKTIVSRQGLNTTAFTKTVYMTPDLGDTVQLVMYAENLGTLAPNTGLLVLLYDNKRQEIRFSGDLSKNAAITLRRRQKL